MCVTAAPPTPYFCCLSLDVPAQYRLRSAALDTDKGCCRMSLASQKWSELACTCTCTSLKATAREPELCVTYHRPLLYLQDGDQYMVLWDEDLLQPRNSEPMDYTAAAPDRVRARLWLVARRDQLLCWLLLVPIALGTDCPLSTHKLLVEHKCLCHRLCTQVLPLACAAQVERVKVSHLQQHFVNFAKNDKLGQVSTWLLAHADAEGADCPACDKLARLHSQAVDFPKTGRPATISPGQLSELVRPR